LELPAKKPCSLVLLFLCVLASGAILVFWGDADTKIAVGVGLAISFGNAILGFALLSWGFKRSHNAFLLSVYGGTILRFLLIFSLLFILIGALNLDRVALIFTLVATYFLFMGLEIFQIHKYSDIKRK
jgi:predicted permease